MALRAGAKKVLFVEEGSVIEVARQTVAKAGFSERAEFLQINSFELALAERADVVVCDHVGYFGFDYGILGLLSDAKKRLVKPGGIIIPTEIELRIGLVASKVCRDLVGKWRDGSVPEEYSWVGKAAANSKHSVDLRQQDLITASEKLATLELGSDVPPYLSWTAEFSCERDGLIDGIAGWFDCRLFDDVHMSNSPESSSCLSRPQAYLPLDEPLAVRAGDRVRLTIMARPEDEIIAWLVELPDTGKRFSHTTFNGLLLDENSLNRSRPDRLAKLSERGRARQVILSYCDGQRTIADVEELVIRDDAGLFPSPHATSWFVNTVLRWDTSE